MQLLLGRLKRMSPVTLTFVLSLLLSLIADLGAVTVGRDAAFYIDIADRILHDGPSAAFESFNWPWFLFLIAGSKAFLGIPTELAAYIWCALFMAGACALMVACVRRVWPERGYWACLVVLSFPVLNDFRDDILREYGFWCFSMLSLWLTLVWNERGGWIRASLVYVAIMLAALFRLEAVLLVVALAIWQLAGLRSRQDIFRAIQFMAVPLSAAAVIGVILFGFFDFSQPRVAYYLSMISPDHLISAFDVKASALESAILNQYMADQAGTVLFLTLSVVLLYNIAGACGIYLFLFFTPFGWSACRAWARSFAPFMWSAACYVGVLFVFFVQQDFINSRYLSFLHWLAVPLFTAAVFFLVSRYPRIFKLVVAVLVLQSLVNVISLGAKKTHYIEAGHWVSENLPADASVYYEDGRISYYAGRGYQLTKPALNKALESSQAERFSYFVLDAKVDEPWVQSWLVKEHRRVLASFANRKGSTVLIIGY